MRKTYSELLVSAERQAAAGFGTKAAKKNALDLCSCAFDQVREQFREIGRTECEAAGKRWYDMPAEWREAMDSLPYSLAHWNAKRAAVIAAYPAIVATANECKATRDKVEAVPVVKRPPVRTPAQLAADAKARTCQICGRPIFAETGLIAHHGYQRPGDGWQTASCYGARELPFEADSAALVRYIAALKNGLAGMIESRARIAAAGGPVTRHFTRHHGRGFSRDKTSHSVTFTLETLPFAIWFAAPAFGRFGTINGNSERLSLFHEYQTLGALYAECLTMELRERSAKIQQQKEYIAAQEKRLAGWVRLEQWNATSKKWESV